LLEIISSSFVLSISILSESNNHCFEYGTLIPIEKYVAIISHSSYIPSKIAKIMSEDERKMYPCTCSDCGKESQVPFQPIEGRDVFCKECLPKHRKPRDQNKGRY
jgi:CxxC-x17-CxxC domain-containing protein